MLSYDSRSTLIRLDRRIFVNGSNQEGREMLEKTRVVRVLFSFPGSLLLWGLTSAAVWETKVLEGTVRAARSDFFYAVQSY